MKDDTNRENTAPVTAARRIGEDLLITRQGAVSIVTMDRPAKLNAMRQNFWAELRTALNELERDECTRAIIITGAGDKAFSAGGDIASFAELKTLAAKRAFQAEAMRTFAAVEETPLPVIAAVNGWALGGGCELTMACDMVIASDRAMFGMPEATIGLVPGFGVLRSPSILGRQMTKLLVMAGERLTAQAAFQCGLVQRVVPHVELMPAALQLADRIAANSSYAHAVGKKLINRGVDRGEFDYSIEAVTVLHCTEDTAEGIRAFVEKRPPRFGRRG